MKPFIHDDFMLQNEIAKKLYHEHAKKMPIINSLEIYLMLGYLVITTNGV